MENEEQAANESSPIKPKTSPVRLVVMGVLLSAMVVMALVQSGARSDRDAAATKADELDDFATPADYMKALDKTPRVKSTEVSLTQVYRWQGVLQHFELRVKFMGSDGSYTAQGTESSSISRFKGKGYSKLKLAKKSGTEYELSPKEPLEMGEDSGGGAGNFTGLPPVPSKGNVDPATMEGPPTEGTVGGSRGGGRMSAERMKEGMVASFEKLELNEAQQAKVNAIIEKQLAETMALMGGPREGMREKFGVLREKYTAQFKEALTEDQFEAYEKARDEARKNRGGGRGGGGAPPRVGPPEPSKQGN